MAKLSISFSSYEGGESARFAIVKQVAALPEINDVEYFTNGWDVDTFNASVENDLLEVAERKIGRIPGISVLKY